MDPEARLLQRHQFLAALYNRVGDDRYIPCKWSWIAQDMNIDLRQAQLIAEHLHTDGLVQIDHNGGISITVPGINAVEARATKPRGQIEYVPHSVIQVGTMTHSVIQQHSPGAIASAALSSKKIETVKRLVAEITQLIDRMGLSPDERSDVLAELKIIKEQLDSTSPDSSIITKAFSFIQSLTEKVIANVVTSGITLEIGKLLAQ